MSFSRFAIYYVPPGGPMADFGASWLGWDIARGRGVAQPDLPDVPDLRGVTEGPRKYGFHATLKPPFRLAQGRDATDLALATSALAASLAPAHCTRLRLTALGRFLALTPEGDAAPLSRVAAACVRSLDGFRAPLTKSELARRRQRPLSPRQDTLLAAWGYPYVMEEFRFHMTLTGRLPTDQVAHWTEILARRLPALPEPFLLDQIALCGERTDGRFEIIDRFALAG